jgi:hypothetical protein
MAAHVVALELAAAAVGSAGWQLARWARARKAALGVSLAVSGGGGRPVEFQVALSNPGVRSPEIRWVHVEFREPGPRGREFYTWRWGVEPFRMDPQETRCLRAEHFVGEWGPGEIAAKAVVVTEAGRSFRSPEVTVVPVSPARAASGGC